MRSQADIDAERRSHERAYHGPVVMLSNAEAKRCLHALSGADDAQARGIKSKVRAACVADSSWREPLD